jgi:ParB family transcriptional regulator, chromosome partitioning protein
MSNRKKSATEASNIIFVQLMKLKKSPKNVRKVPHSNADIMALAASISSLGMLQYPVVEPEIGTKGKPTGNYLVNAGEGRRLAQLARVKLKEIKKDEAIPCILDTEHSATEISLAENAIRTSMHPADEYEAFAELHHQQGMSAEDIAARFGVTAAVVRQRLKLGAVSPALLTLYREDEMNLEQLTAFTITDDHARQEQVWADLGFNNNRRAILRALTEGQVATDDRRVTFVGIEAYQAAGGAVINDLFDEDGGYLADTALLNRLTREKLQRVAETVTGEGWKWIEVDPEFDYQRASAMSCIEAHPKPLNEDEQSRLASLQEQLEALCAAAEQDDPSEDTLAQIEALEVEIAALTEEVYRPEDIARAGAFIALGRDGQARIERGYLRPEDASRPEKSQGSEAGAESGEGDRALSAALVADLTAQRTAALRNDLAQAPELALIAVAHALAAQTFYRGSALSCLEIVMKPVSLSSFASGINDSVAGQEIEARHQTWAARLPEDGSVLWHFVASLPMDQMLSLMAHCASLSLDAVQRPGFQPGGEALSHAALLARAMPQDMNRYWQPTVASYLGRVGKDRILEAVREGAGEKAVGQIAGLKKQAMAARAEHLLTGKGWLPSLLQAV